MGVLEDLLHRMHDGDKLAREHLFAVAYEELRSMAHLQLKNGGRDTLLNTTVLLHESYLRFRNAGQLTGTDRSQFFSYAARVMRSVIVDFARQRQAERRGHDAERVTLTMQLAEKISATDDEVVKISDALDSLQQIDERLVCVVEMRYFSGMTEGEIAAALCVTERTVRRYWEKARRLLIASLQ